MKRYVLRARLVDDPPPVCDAQAEFIGELSANANKELSIEVSLNQISSRWQDVTIDIVEYKEVYHKIRSTEDLFQVRTNDTVQLESWVVARAVVQLWRAVHGPPSDCPAMVVVWRRGSLLLLRCWRTTRCRCRR